jgi:hypothetical protein
MAGDPPKIQQRANRISPKPVVAGHQAAPIASIQPVPVVSKAIPSPTFHSSYFNSDAFRAAVYKQAMASYLPQTIAKSKEVTEPAPLTSDQEHTLSVLEHAGAFNPDGTLDLNKAVNAKIPLDTQMQYTPYGVIYIPKPDSRYETVTPEMLKSVLPEAYRTKVDEAVKYVNRQQELNALLAPYAVKGSNTYDIPQALRDITNGVWKNGKNVDVGFTRDDLYEAFGKDTVDRIRTEMSEQWEHGKGSFMEAHPEYYDPTSGLFLYQESEITDWLLPLIATAYFAAPLAMGAAGYVAGKVQKAWPTIERVGTGIGEAVAPAGRITTSAEQLGLALKPEVSATKTITVPKVMVATKVKVDLSWLNDVGVKAKVTATTPSVKTYQKVMPSVAAVRVAAMRRYGIASPTYVQTLAKLRAARTQTQVRVLSRQVLQEVAQVQATRTLAPIETQIQQAAQAIAVWPIISNALSTAVRNLTDVSTEAAVKTQIRTSIKTALQNAIKTETNPQVKQALKQKLAQAVDTLTKQAMKAVKSTSRTTKKEAKSTQQTRRPRSVDLETPSGKTVTLTEKQLKQSYAWRQGFVYKLWYPPHTKATLISVTKRPPFVQVVEGEGSAQKSLTKRGLGAVTVTQVAPMGIVGVQVVKRKGKPFLRFPKRSVAEVRSSK